MQTCSRERSSVQMSEGIGMPGAAGAHLQMSEAAVAETPQTSTVRKLVALAFAIAYLVAAPLSWVQSAQADSGRGEDGSGVTQGTSGPGGGGSEDDADDDDNGGDGDGDDSGTNGTSAKGDTTAGTSNDGESTGGAD